MNLEIDFQSVALAVVCTMLGNRNLALHKIAVNIAVPNIVIVAVLVAGSGNE
jgi:hypothetical protein